MSVVLVIMFVIYAILMVIASNKRIFEMPAPVDISNIDIEHMMEDADGKELTIGRDQFEKFKATLSRTANVGTTMVAVAMTDAVLMLIMAWNGFGTNETLLCVAACYLIQKAPKE